jgi:hypothetical protein
MGWPDWPVDPGEEGEVPESSRPRGAGRGNRWYTQFGGLWTGDGNHSIKNRSLATRIAVLSLAIREGKTTEGALAKPCRQQDTAVGRRGSSGAERTQAPRAKQTVMPIGKGTPPLEMGVSVHEVIPALVTFFRGCQRSSVPIARADDGRRTKPCSGAKRTVMPGGRSHHPMKMGSGLVYSGLVRSWE